MPSKNMSKNGHFIVGLVVIVIIGLATTLYSGSMTGRWQSFSGLDDARKVLKEMPMKIGDWEADQENEMSADEVAILRVQNGYISRAYRNTRTRATVYLVIMIGPTGRVVVHTPEICFGGKDYAKEQERTSVPIAVSSIDGSKEMDDTFWKVDFVNRSLDLNGRISFYYAVSIGDAWVATERPRQTFQAYRYAYKIQVQSFTDAENDSVKAFLEECLPVIHQSMRPCR